MLRQALYGLKDSPQQWTNRNFEEDRKRAADRERSAAESVPKFRRVEIRPSLRNACCYCEECSDYDHAIRYWVKSIESGRYGKDLLRNKCYQCGAVVSRRTDDWHTACFRCERIACQSCSVRKDDSPCHRTYPGWARALPDGPIGKRQFPGRCEYLERGRCFAGKFCEVQHVERDYSGRGFELRRGAFD